MTDFAWDPEDYPRLMAEEIADYPRLQDTLVSATVGRPVRTVLDLGTGTGETAGRVLAAHRDATLTGVDASAEMLAAAGTRLDPARVRLSRQRLEDPLPDGPFDLVVSALAAHHLDGPAKADLFGRVAAVLAPGGRFVLADIVVPVRAEDAFTEIDWVDDVPSSAADQLTWMAAAGLDATEYWAFRDLAVLVADRPVT